MSKKLEDISKRHSLIKSIITSQEVYNQTQLVRLLKQNGIRVTQATLSRDLNDLGIVRVPTPKGTVYKVGESGTQSLIKSRISEEVISIDNNEQLIVIRTFTGRAQGVAVFIDSQKQTEILGTIAGDDTILIIPRSIKKMKTIIEQLKTTLGIT
ncbi:MAG: arginine repressor [Melioribacteraceae bacterium]|jgi:transcriptional regulator of arginine metabolism|nr:arginine repressor [Melioribacteraceae bacterium]